MDYKIIEELLIEIVYIAFILAFWKLEKNTYTMNLHIPGHG